MMYTNLPAILKLVEQVLIKFFFSLVKQFSNKATS